MPDSAHIRRVVLLGFMCSGKSVVGESLARRLNWDFLDFDVEIEQREGRSVAEIIDADGEEYFRRLEADLTAEAGEHGKLVLAPGGGWITNPDLLQSLRPGTFAAWLHVSPQETVRRLMDDPNPRPFKDHPDPITPIREMIEQRAPLYRLADLSIPADGRGIESIAFELEQIVRGRYTAS